MIPMNAKTRLDLLLNQSILSSNQDAYPSSKLSSVMTTTTTTTAVPPLPPRRDASSMKHHRRRYQIEQNGEQKASQPLLNSSTLDDLFRALTLECEQYLAASSSSSSQKKIANQSIAQPSSTAVESNDEDYENLHPSPMSSVSMNSSSSPLKTSIQVISPIKRHVVSITVSSKVTSPIKPSSPSPSSSVPIKTIPPPPTSAPVPVLPSSTNTRRSSEEDSINKSSSSTTRKHRRRRTRRQYLSSTTPTTRSSSSSTERKEILTEKKPIISKRSCSTDPRYQHPKSSHENPTVASQKQSTKRPRRRDVSLQHHLPHSRRPQENHHHHHHHLAPLSILLTSTKSTSDFLDHSHQRPQQQRRSRLETVNHRSAALLDRIHSQFYRPSPTRNNPTKTTNNNNNILPHRIPSYPVY